ncbi:MAG: hypothetical protein ACOYL6_18145 [Bacteriovoracaceae bacterium]
MKPKIAIFINGPINSGKSSIARELSSLLPGIYIDGYDLKSRTEESILFELFVTQTIKNILLEVLRISSEDSTPIVAYPLRKEDWILVKNSCHHANILPIVITLSPTLQTTLTNRGGRELTAWEINRIKEMYDQGYHQREFSDLVLSNDHQTAKESAARILHFLKSKS